MSEGVAKHKRGVVVMCACLLPLATSSAQQEDQDAPVFSNRGADTCLRCHDEDSEVPVLDIFKTPHGSTGNQRAAFGRMQCETCHGPGGAHTGRVRRGKERPGIRKFGATGKTPIAEQNGVCSGCHEQAIGVAWHGGAHESNDIACVDCHSVHVQRDPVLNKKTQADTCFACHKEQRAESYKASVHPLRYGKMACTDCHDAHGSDSEFELTRDNTNDTCYTCHAEKRGPFLWEHAPVAEDCSLCHKPHGSNHPALLTKRAPLLCQECHSQEGHPSVPHTPAALTPPGASGFLLGNSCTNCHTQVHGSNHPSGSGLTR